MKTQDRKRGRRVPRPAHVDRKWARPKQRPQFRVFRVHPDHYRIECFEVFVFRTRRDMQAGWQKYEGRPFEPNDERCMGRCVTYGGQWGNSHYHRTVMRGHYSIGRMFFNADDLRRNPAEIMSHEATHAAMGWARHRKADLSKMVGEEVMCHAQGIMMMWVNHGTRFLFR